MTPPPARPVFPHHAAVVVLPDRIVVHTLCTFGRHTDIDRSVRRAPAAALLGTYVDGGGGEAPAGGEEVPGVAAARGRRRRRPPQHRQVRAALLRSVPRPRRVLGFCSGWVPRPSAQRLRDRHLHA